MSTYKHMRVSLRGLLVNAIRGEHSGLRSMTGNDGKPLSVLDAADGVIDELLKGNEYMPLGKCDNFKDGDCQGHEEEA